MNRPDGYYWVKTPFHNGEWMIAYCRLGTVLHLVGNEESYDESMFHEIGPRIDTPTETHNNRIEKG